MALKKVHRRYIKYFFPELDLFSSINLTDVFIYHI